jgi:hypothetical protein
VAVATETLIEVPAGIVDVFVLVDPPLQFAVTM